MLKQRRTLAFPRVRGMWQARSMHDIPLDLRGWSHNGSSSRSDGSRSSREALLSAFGLWWCSGPTTIRPLCSELHEVAVVLQRSPSNG